MRENLYNRLTDEDRLKLDVLSKDMPVTIQTIIKALESNTSVLELKLGIVIELQNFLQPNSITSNDIFKLFND
jgi:hypothetical protein